MILCTQKRVVKRFAGLELEPARSRLGHPGLAIGLIIVHSAVVPEGSTAYDIYNDEDDEDDNVDDRGLPPTMPEAGEDARFARVAIEAELLLVIAPSGAIHIINNHCSTSWVPYGLIEICVAT